MTGMIPDTRRRLDELLRVLFLQFACFTEKYKKRRQDISTPVLVVFGIPLLRSSARLPSLGYWGRGLLAILLLNGVDLHRR